jgi:hypothetical protein
MTTKKIKPVLFRGKTSEQLESEGKMVSDEFMKVTREMLRGVMKE